MKKLIALFVLTLSTTLFAQVPKALSQGLVVFALPIPFGGKIGWNFSLYGSGPSDYPNQFSYGEAGFTLTTVFPATDPKLKVEVTGKMGPSTIVESDAFGCYDVRFNLNEAKMTVSGIDGTILRIVTPKSADYWQNFCTLGAENFWAAGGLTILAP